VSPYSLDQTHSNKEENENNTGKNLIHPYSHHIVQQNSEKLNPCYNSTLISIDFDSLSQMFSKNSIASIIIKYHACMIFHALSFDEADIFGDAHFQTSE